MYTLRLADLASAGCVTQGPERGVSVATELEIAEARKLLERSDDGPITSFVLCARACRLSAGGKHDPEAVANALFEALDAIGCEMTDEELV